LTAQLVAELAFAGEIGEAAFAFARLEYPALDVTPYRARLDAMAAAVAGTDHLALRRIVAIREGIGGDADTYGDPRNSFLPYVLDRRKGIPISLAAIWMEVGRRASIEVQGVGLPGHFLVYAAGQLCDPFHGGEAIGSEEAAVLVADSMGGKPRLNPEWLTPVTAAEMVRRMLRNLDAIYAEAGQPRAWVHECQAALARAQPA